MGQRGDVPREPRVRLHMESCPPRAWKAHAPVAGRLACQGTRRNGRSTRRGAKRQVGETNGYGAHLAALPCPGLSFFARFWIVHLDPNNTGGGNEPVRQLRCRGVRVWPD